MPLLEERLRSRFEWGLTVDIGPPDLETRLAILQDKMRQAGVDISPDVLALIARQVRRNIRELEGSLNRVMAYARLLRTEVTPELACRALKDIAGRAVEDGHISPTLVITTVAEGFQLTTEDLTSRRRDKDTALARQVAMYLLRQQNGCSLAEVGFALGGRNPSTVNHACQKVAFDIEANPLLKRKVGEIQKTIGRRLKGRALR